MFYQWFFDLWRSRETPSTFTEKRNAFLILLRAILQKGPQKYQETTGFIRFPALGIPMSQNVVLTMVSLVFWRVLVNRFGALWGLAHRTDLGFRCPDLTKFEIQLIAPPFFWAPGKKGLIFCSILGSERLFESKGFSNRNVFNQIGPGSLKTS